jgi:uncharacterized protein (TIGR03435 family)
MPLKLGAMRLMAFLVAGLSLARAEPTAGQQPKPTFEIASVKRSPAANSNWQIDSQPGGRFVATNTPLMNLIQSAYSVRDFQVIDVPSWVAGARFDVDARANREVSASEASLMLQALLEDRFQLRLRREQRELPIFELVLARSDKRLGPSLVRMSSPGDCKAALAKQARARGDAAVFQMCGTAGSLASFLSIRTGRRTEDRTALTGTFHITLHYAFNPVAAASDAPALETALQEQLGLKVQSSRGPVDVLIVESIQPPIEN